MSTLCAGKFCNQAIIKGTYETRDTEYEIETQIETPCARSDWSKTYVLSEYKA